MLNIEGLHVHYGKIEALKGISMHVDDNEIVTLIGANGAGKTTILHTISGLIGSSAGKISFNDTDITNMNSTHRVKLGISQSPEGRRIFPKMTVYENLEMGAFLRKDKPGINVVYSLELVVGIEPTTCSLRMSCSAIEPHQLIKFYR